MKPHVIAVSFTLAAALAMGGCGGKNMASQLASNEQMRNEVMSAITSNPELAVIMQEKLLASDSLRTRIVDTVLHDTNSSQYVLYRVATNQDAMDLVLKAAVADSSMRTHVLTLLKGVEMAQGMK